MVSLFLVISFVVIVSGALLVVLPEGDEKVQGKHQEKTIIDAECW